LQAAPETEEEMMVEVFKYTERVVNMIRPRKLLFMAIGKFHFVSITSLDSLNRWRGSSCQNESTTISSVPICSGGQREGRSEERICGNVGR
jgi:hypothetical protein